MTWKIFDNSDDEDSEADVKIIAGGTMPCDDIQHTVDASVGKHHDLGVLALTARATNEADEVDESVWVIVANE